MYFLPGLIQTIVESIHVCVASSETSLSLNMPSVFGLQSKRECAPSVCDRASIEEEASAYWSGTTVCRCLTSCRTEIFKGVV